MKAIINGTLYDTSKATEIAEYDNGLSLSDFRFITETLYLTQKGNWFLHARGGALTEYAESYGGGYTDGAELISMTEKEVLEWCESRNIQSDKVLELLSDSFEEA